MALISCKDCKKDFSTDAARCPHCGAFKPMDKNNLNYKGKSLVNLQTGKKISLHNAGFYCFLIGPFYFLFWGIWAHVILSAAAALLTAGISWLVYPFFAQSIVRNHCLLNGWKPAD